jgi:hypothetical protein
MEFSSYRSSIRNNSGNIIKKWTKRRAATFHIVDNILLPTTTTITTKNII